MGLQEEFETAAEDAKKLPSSVSNDDMLALYGLYKQANFGDNNTKKPFVLDPKGRAKWQAWEDQKGKDKETAQTEYIALVKQLAEKYMASS